MKPKTRSELREQFINPLYEFMKRRDDLLSVEKDFVQAALRFLLCADYHLAHLGVSHEIAFQRELLNNFNGCLSKTHNDS